MRLSLLAVAVGMVGALFLPACQPVDRQAQLEEFATSCQVVYGFRTGTDGFAQCMMVQDQMARESAELNRARIAAAMQSAGDSFTRAGAQNRRMNCTHTPGFGGTVNTSCF